MADPDGRGVRLGIGQRLWEDDPGGHVVDSGRYEYLQIPQVFHQPTEKKPRRVTVLGWTDPRTQEGELMFPARFGQAYIDDERKTLGTAGFSAQHDQDPEPAGGILFKRDSWRYYPTPPGWDELSPPEKYALLGIQRTATGWDTALAETQEADYSAKITIGQAQNKFYVLDYWKEKVAYPVVEAKIITDWSKWRVTGVPIEGKGSHSGKAAVQSVRSKSTVPAIEVANIDKFVRASQVSPTVEANVVYLPAEAPWVDDFVSTMSRYPKVAHDDDVDAFCVALAWLLFGETSLGMLEWLRQQAEAKAKAAAGGAAA